MRNQSGFTLVELMVALTIAAILLGLAVPSFINLVVGSRLTTQSNELVTAIHQARSEAVRRNQQVRLCRAAGPAATNCAGAGVWEHWIMITGAGDVIRRGRLSRHGGSIGITSTLPAATLVLSPDGLARTTTGALANGESITVCANSGIPENNRRINLGAGSRLSTVSLQGNCTW